MHVALTVQLDFLKEEKKKDKLETFTESLSVTQRSIKWPLLLASLQHADHNEEHGH